MKIYNTLTRKIEQFVPNDNRMVQMYTCGPTVYHYAHIGNLRSYIAEDVLEKTLRYLGYSVNRVMNITDVGHLSSDSDSGEDKMVSSAIREHKTVLDIAKFYTDKFFQDCNDLNIKRPDVVCPATSMISQYIDMIEVLLIKGYAYQAGGNIYFDTSKLDDYYVLTNHKEDEMVVGVREGVEEDQNKRNQADFVLWFTKSKFNDQELKWDSPFGVGYPGWHIECSCISKKYCGEYLDIHCGGVDNIFPHHTNEIAQSEAYLGHKWCNYWFHVEHLNDKNGKMSKSKGEFLTVDTLKNKGYNPLSYRYLCLQSHYRKQMVFSYETLDNAQNAYMKLKTKIQALNDNTQYSENDFNTYKQLFVNYLSDDLNTSSCVTVLYDVLKANISDKTKLELVKSFDTVLGLSLLDSNNENIVINEEVLQQIELRTKAKAEKNYALADQIRDDLAKKGVKLIDTKEGTKFEIL